MAIQNTLVEMCKDVLHEVEQRIPESLKQHHAELSAIGTQDVTTISEACRHFEKVCDFLRESFETNEFCFIFGIIESWNITEHVTDDELRELKRDSAWRDVMNLCYGIKAKEKQYTPIDEDELVQEFCDYAETTHYVSFAQQLYVKGKYPYIPSQNLVELDSYDTMKMFLAWQGAKWNVTFDEFCALIGRKKVAGFTHKLEERQ